MRYLYFIILFSASTLSIAQSPAIRINGESALRLAYSFRERATCGHSHGGITYMAGFTTACVGTSCTHASAVVATDSAGKHLWSRRVGFSEQISPYSSTSDADGNIYVASMMYPARFTDPKVCIYKLNPSGQLMWSRMYGGDFRHTPKKIMVIGNTLLVAGFSQDSNYDGIAFLLKTDLNGNQKWLRYYSHPDYDVQFNDMLMSPEGNLDMAIWLYDWFGQSFVSGMYQTDTAGTYVRKLLMDGYHSLEHIDRLSDGSVVGVFGSGVFKTNAQMTNFDWIRTHGVNAKLTEVAVLPGDEILLGGVAGASGPTPGSGLLARIGADGGLIWHKTQGKGFSTVIDELIVNDQCQAIALGYSSHLGGPDWYQVRTNSDGDFGPADTLDGFSFSPFPVQLGEVNLTPVPVNDPPIVFTALYEIGVVYDSMTIAHLPEPAAGCESVGIDRESLQPELVFSPNPAHTSVRITAPWQTGTARKTMVQAIDMQGRVVQTATMEGDVFNWPVKRLTPGLYVLRLVSGEDVATGRLLVE
jgi:hypothetical protein